MKKILKFFLIIFSIIILIIIYAGTLGMMGLNTKEYTIMEDNLPNNFDGLKIVHFSDLHYNRGITTNKVKSIVDEINLIKPDIVVFTGDLVDKDMNLGKDDYEKLTKELKRINASLGKYAVLGEDDYELDQESVIKVYEDSDFTYLDNSYDIIYNKYHEKIFIGGLNNVTHEQNDLDKLFNDKVKELNIPYMIILVHEPDISDEIALNYEPNLILAGHSHNGQIRLPYLGAVYTPPFAKVYYEDYYEINNTKLYISSGLGVSTINARLFNHPSLNLYRIYKNNTKESPE